MYIHIVLQLHGFILLSMVAVVTENLVDSVMLLSDVQFPPHRTSIP